MEHLAENIIAIILAARTISEEQKTAMLDKFGDDSITDEELKAMLDTLCDAEIALRNEENAKLLAMREENNIELAAEEARIAPEKVKIEQAAATEDQTVLADYKRDMGTLDHQLSTAIETFKRNEHEAGEMHKIRTSLGIGSAEADGAVGGA